jgi:hypothetical protein
MNLETRLKKLEERLTPPQFDNERAWDFLVEAYYSTSPPWTPADNYREREDHFEKFIGMTRKQFIDGGK